MVIENIHKIGVAGAGTMGSGIAQIFAMAGYQIILFDINEEQLDVARQNINENLEGAIKRGKLESDGKSNILEKISYSTKLQDLKVDLFIEAVVEKLDIKQDLFRKTAEINSDSMVLATNTSTIPITQIAFGLPHPERVIGLHFFNPAHIMKLVEIIAGADTSDKVVNIAKELVAKTGKKAVIARDAPGFIVNRVARHFYVESLKILEENVADIETIDNLIESTGFKMGPFKLMDLIGVDTNYLVTSTLYDQFDQDPKFRPNRIQKQKVDAGYLGRKTGKGFYNY